MTVVTITEPGAPNASAAVAEPVMIQPSNGPKSPATVTPPAFIRPVPDFRPPQKSQESQGFWSGVAYYGYRWYDPTTGRWPSRDPIEESGGMNLYGFVGNNGACAWDKLGQSMIGMSVLRATFELDYSCVGCCLFRGVWSLANERCRDIYSNIIEHGNTYTKDYVGFGQHANIGFAAEMEAMDNAAQLILDDQDTPPCYKYTTFDEIFSESYWVPDPEA